MHPIQVKVFNQARSEAAIAVGPVDDAGELDPSLLVELKVSSSCVISLKPSCEAFGVRVAATDEAPTRAPSICIRNELCNTTAPCAISATVWRGGKRDLLSPASSDPRPVILHPGMARNFDELAGTLIVRPTSETLSGLNWENPIGPKHKTTNADKAGAAPTDEASLTLETYSGAGGKDAAPVAADVDNHGKGKGKGKGKAKGGGGKR